MIEPVFIPMCEYLRLDEKCFRLPVLSRTIKRAFNPARCCNDYISFDIKHVKSNADFIIPYLQYASRVKGSII